jgi:hypothetical protein
MGSLGLPEATVHQGFLHTADRDPYHIPEDDDFWDLWQDGATRIHRINGGDTTTLTRLLY